MRCLKIFLCLIICLSTLSGCTNIKEVNEDNETILYIDDAGREVNLPNKIESVIPTGPLSQLVLFALCPEMLVGLGSKWPKSANGIIADEYLDLPYFGKLYSSAELNVEALALANPDIIIDIGEYKENLNEDLDGLQNQMGIPTVFIDAKLEKIPEVFRKLGDLLGKEERAEELASFCEEIYEQTEKVMMEVDNNKIDVIYCLTEDSLNVFANGSYNAQLLDWLTNNIAVVENPSSSGLGNATDIEQISLWNPDVILFAPGGVYNSAKDNGTWNQLDAIKNNRYLEMPETPYGWMGNPPGVQQYLGMIWLVYQLYPEYATYDAKSQILKYYELFYHVLLTDEQFTALTKNSTLN